ncbi:hypothetical protein ACJMK2_033700 [Sinanodonta woodiana]|uniref:Palmitoyltransferase n=1 Tax=Sinanodonta woodiana TaxID=1069815 RepID=A0ABD3WSQ8_SINWO
MAVLKKIKQLIHWGPIIALSIIFFVANMAIKCDFRWWPISESGGFLNLVIFVSWVVLTLYNYFLAAFKGPGFVPLGWKPSEPSEAKYLQYCEVCEGYKCPRSHHCRKCNRCVMKMDHHCPWINICCGHFNHANFVYFLFFAPVGCVHALLILIPSVYRALNVHWYIMSKENYPIVYLGVWEFIMCMFAIGLAFGVIIAVGTLFIIQLKSILKNETGIETWIKEKAEELDRDEDEGRFVYPYHLGWWKNLKYVFSLTKQKHSDGYSWPVIEGCNQYTFTIEQLKQKAVKRERTVQYIIVDDYHGSMLPISKGYDMCCGIPCTDEPRIPVRKGDRVDVTRWKRKWLYGTKLLTGAEEEGKKRVRGWFPRRCAQELSHEEVNGIMSDNKKEN